MSLSPGTRIGSYEITGTLGAGGMGEVYRATDTHLGRDVAIKVLPDAFAHDPERLARFEREARTLAALNHPNIATIHGFEKAGAMQALVMELVDGPTLADRIAQGALPLDEALPIAKQIADALEAAHEQGIIHRDLKPANVKLRADGAVKVLDFGLAKMTEPAGGVTSTASLSPTITSPAMTQLGVILGTAAYMSPEQAKGRGADKRSDVWAFGCVLYEMLTGRRAFDGEDMTDVLGAVVRLEPDWTALPPTVPPLIATFLRSCLVKDRRQRVADTATALFVLDKAAAFTTPHSKTGSDQIGRRGVRRRIAAFSAAAIVLGAAAGTGLTWLLTRPDSPPVTRLTVAPSGAAALWTGRNVRNLAVAPDGGGIVYLGNNGSQLFVRALGQLDPTPLTGVGAPRGPFLSPDGRWVGYVDNTGVLNKVAITGGPPVPMCRIDGIYRGATWGPDGTIVFATSITSVGLQRVSADGGEPTVLTKPDSQRGEVDHYWPEFLPGGQAVLFTIIPTTGIGNAQIAVLDLRNGSQKILVRGGSHAHYVTSGHLVYSAAGTLRAVTFDLDRLEAGSTPVPVVSQVVDNPSGSADFDVAQNGTLVYISGAMQVEARTLVWVDRGGREETLGAPARPYIYPRLSPTEPKLAVAILDEERDIWIWDLKRQGFTRLTTDAADDRYPVWTPDGKRLAWDSTRHGPYNLFWQAADGTGTVERLTDSPNTHASHAFTADGKQLILREDASGGQNLAVLTLDGKRTLRPLLNRPFNERNGEISPDGKWLAYEADESGPFEVYVRPFPDVEASKTTVSLGGGRQPLWAANGRELFYRGQDGTVIGVTVRTAGSFEVTGPRTTLVRGAYYDGDGGIFGRTYDVSADGKRFLMIRQDDARDPAESAPTITVVQNWTEELKRLVPAK